MSAEELKSIALVIRALVTSRQSPYLLRDILREYREFENHPMQYRELGYNSPKDLLEATGEFNFVGGGNDTCVIVKPSCKSHHIVQLVKNQRTSRSRIHARSVKQKRNSTRTDLQVWNKSSYSSNTNGKKDPNFNQKSTRCSRRGGVRNNNQIDQNNLKRIAEIEEEQKKIRQKVAQTAKGTKQKQVATAPAARAAEPLQAKQTENNFRDLRDMLNSKTAARAQQHKQNIDRENDLAAMLNAKVTENNFRDLGDMLNSKAAARAQQHEHNNNNINGENDLADMLNAKLRIEQGTTTSAAQRNVHVGGRKLTLHDRLNLNGKLRGVREQQQQQLKQQVEQMSGEQFLKQIQHEKQLLLLQLKQEQEREREQHQQQQLQFGNGAAAAVPVPYVNNTNNVAPFKRSVQERLHNIRNNAFAAPSTNGLELSSATIDLSPLAISTVGSDIEQMPYLSSTTKPVAVENSHFIDSRSCHMDNKQQGDPVARLAKYCLKRNYDAPVYAFTATKFRHNLLCRVSVEGNVYSTYPNEYTDEISAAAACAKIALEKLQEQEAKLSLPPCQYTDQEFIDILHNELLKHPAGIFAKNMDNWYETTFEEKLKENWWTLVSKSTKFKTELNCDNLIVFANTNVVDNYSFLFLNILFILFFCSTLVLMLLAIERNRCPGADSLLHIEQIDSPGPLSVGAHI